MSGKLWALLGAAVIGLGIAGCNGGDVETKVSVEPTSLKPVEGTLKVALLTPGPVSDSGWSALAYEGLEAIKEELGAETSHLQATDSGIRDGMRRFAQDGFHLVIGHGFEYNDPAMEVGVDFPETVFVSSSGDKSSGNVGAFRFTLEEGFYLAGFLAGKMSESGTVAMVGGPDVPSIRSTFAAFKAGAEAAKPSISVLEVFTRQETDVAAAKQATLQVISQGADFVIHQANAAAVGVFEACAEKDVWCFGANSNQNSVNDKVIASAVIVAKPAFVELAKQVKEGRFKGGVQRIGLNEGAVGFIVNPKASSAITPEIRQELDDLQLKIFAGNVNVPIAEF